jgi:hypothetical protein
LVINAVVSDHAKFMTADIEDFYLGTPLSEGNEVYMRIPISQIPSATVA